MNFKSLAKDYQTKIGKKLNLLFLCADNTCRSATADILARKLFGNTAIIKSAGLRVADRGIGKPMKIQAQHILCDYMNCRRERAYSQHRSKQVTQQMIANATHIFVMDRGLLREFFTSTNAIYNQFKYKTKLLCHQDPVPDPWDKLHYQNGIEIKHLTESEKSDIYSEMIKEVEECLYLRINNIFRLHRLAGSKKSRKSRTQHKKKSQTKK